MDDSPKKRKIHRAKMCFVIITTIVLFFSCQKELSIENGSIPVTPPDLTTKVSSSVSGFVTDENDAPVLGATVQVGTYSTTTDKFGYFEAKNVSVVKTAATVIVSKSSYFKGIKTWMGVDGKGVFFRIKLIPKSIAGTINAASGGTVTLTNGLSITLPAGAVINATTNSAYNGTINVAAYWINPNASDFVENVPGDHQGVNANGELKLLKTFGMAAVELTGSSGELLQIATGKKATLSTPIPTAYLTDAPSSIPLWYFDESTGLWKEQGTATKTGNNFVGEVSHFSFWDNAIGGNFVYLDFTVLDLNGQPAPNMYVGVVNVNSPGWYPYAQGWTDANGYVSGAVFDSSLLLVKIFNSIYCTTPLYSQSITTAGNNISLGNITAQNLSFISGSVTDCNNLPVTNGSIYVYSSPLYYRYPVSSIGNFSFATILCDPATVTIVAQDLTTQQYSSPYVYNLSTGNNNIGVISACGNTPPEFMYYSVNGTNYSIFSPDGQVSNAIYTYPAVPFEEISAHSYAYYTYGAAGFSEPNIGLGSIQDLIYFKSATDLLIPVSPIPVHITEFGNVGQYISGNFSGMMKNYSPGTTFNITCSFRSKRYQ